MQLEKSRNHAPLPNVITNAASAANKYTHSSSEHNNVRYLLHISHPDTITLFTLWTLANFDQFRHSSYPVYL